MKKMILGLLPILILLFSCQSKKDKKDIFLLLKTSNNIFFNEIEKGVKENIDSTKYNLQVRGGKNESDVSSQLEMLSIINELTGKNNIAGVIVTPTSSNNELVPYLKNLDKKKIPVVLVDTKINEEYLRKENLQHIPFIGSSNYFGGKQAALFLCKNYDPKNIGKILILNGVDGQESAMQRKRGFEDVIDSINNKLAKKIIITERTANWNRLEAQNILEGFKVSGRSFDAIFAANDEMALGAIRALKDNANTKLPIIIGFDAIDEAKDNIAQSKGLVATVVQNPYKMGEESIKEIQDYYKSKELVNKLIETKIISK